MPGPVSDSYDPEFGTGQNARDVAAAIEEAKKKITHAIGSEELKNILEVVHGKGGRLKGVTLSEKELRVIRFAMNRAVEFICCMSRAEPDEMTFVLLGRDWAAPQTIRYWCYERIRLSKNKLDDPQIQEALACADLMEKDRK